MEKTIEEPQSWLLRAWSLALAGVVIGWCAYQLALGTNNVLNADAPGQPMIGSVRLAIATFLITTGIAFAVTWERRRQAWSVAFAGATGLIVAAVITWNGGPSSWNTADGWRLVCALIAVAIAAPFFQVVRDEWTTRDTRTIPYPAIHRHAWTNVVLLFAAFFFVLLVWALSWLLAGLFELAGLHVLTKLLQQGAALLTLSGGALGAGLGLLRDRDPILAALQRVVITIFAIFAPILAIGFAVFLSSLPFTGLTPLWSATKSTTPVLITCCVVAILLINAVIADRPEDEARHPALRWAARLLAAMVTPFAIIASVSTGLRIRQYGLTPDRLWALTFTVIACAYALAYLTALVRSRLGTTWSVRMRAANLRLACGLCILAILLSTPLFSFGAVATRDQLSRLHDGRTAPTQFDWLSMRFDFGTSGQAALRRLATDPDPAIRDPAKRALAYTDRWSARYNSGNGTAVPLASRIRQRDHAPALPAPLLAALAKNSVCRGDGRCFVLVDSSGASAVAVYEGCTERSDPCASAPKQAARFIRDGGGWAFDQTIFISLQNTKTDERQWRAAFDHNAIILAPVVRHRLVIGGHAIEGEFP